FFRMPNNKTLVLAQILPWEIEAETHQTLLKNSFIVANKVVIMTDIHSFKAVIGLVPVGGQRGIIN
ncbi:hypothetical protein J3R82DRAFT_4598, partial [Butyriboletus roseoflavus]